MPLSRRNFLRLSIEASGALVIACLVPGCATMAKAPYRSTAQAFYANAFIRITPDNTLTFILPRSEMGQGVHTTLATLLAEELNIAPEQIHLEMALADRAYDNPIYGIQITGGSTSVKGAWTEMRQAGAQVRALFVLAAAKTWRVSENTCYAKDGFVFHSDSGKRLSFGELIAKASSIGMPKDASLKDQKEFQWLGKPLNRLDIPAMVQGKALYGLDCHRPDALVAVVARAPCVGARLQSFQAEAAKKVQGVRAIVTLPGESVAVVAEHFSQALAGREKLQVQWHLPSNAPSSEAIMAKLAALNEERGSTARSQGDVDDALTKGATVLEAHYTVPYLAHATMEPMNATAQIKNGHVEVWAPTQNQASGRDVAAKMGGVAVDNVTLHTTHLGGGFGRRLEVDYIAEAVFLAKATGHPVQVIWSREDDTSHDVYRPAMHHRLWAALDEEGMPLAWKHRVAGQAIDPGAMRVFAPAALPNGFPRVIKNITASTAEWLYDLKIDKSAVEGAKDIPYQIPNLRVEYNEDNSSAVPVGYWRSVGHSHTAFAVESFIDELCAIKGYDPLAYRQALLRQHPRHLAVLDELAQRAHWGQKQQGRAQGLALHESFGSIVGQVAEVSIAHGQIQVHRVVAVVDAGFVVNPNIAQAQIEGGIVFGLTAALKGKITFQNGAVLEKNFDTYALLRMHECPEIDVYFVDSDRPAEGLGEPGVPPIAPAVGNAVFKLTGKRLRSLPFVLET